MKKMKQRALLIADGHLNLIWPLPRLLHQAGAHLTLLAPRAQCFRRSRFVKEWLDFPLDAATPATVAQVERHLHAYRYDLVVLVSPPLVGQLFQNTPPPAWMSAWFRPDLLRVLSSKTDFQTWASANHLPIPSGRFVTTPDEAVAGVTQQGASVIKLDGTAGGQGVKLVTTAEEVRSAWHALRNPAGAVLQKYIVGKVGCTELIVQRGQVAAWFASFKERSVTPFGASIMRRLVNPPGMAALVAAVATATGFHGLCGFDWILDENGKIWLLEFHPRTPSGFGWGRYAGVDVPAALRDLLDECPAITRAPLPAEQLARAPRCCSFPAHFWFALTQQQSDLRYWLPGVNAVAWRNVPFDDPALLASVCTFALRRLARRHLPRWGCNFPGLENGTA
ncbi:MAG: hypothetical protein EPN23_03755 [Verrucomicrobia bacterium]|nr:MAG: hypothetical protein EPN23_03755 [Verrucomicrobiota bacterium]